MVFSGKDRPALSNSVLAIVIIVVLVVGGVVGYSFPKGKPAAVSTTSTSNTASQPTVSASSSSVSSSSTAHSSSSSSSSSVTGSSTSTTLAAPSPPLFNFTVETAPLAILIAPGSTVLYPSVVVVPRPSTLEGNAIFNQGIGSELVVLNATVPSGITLSFYGSNLTDLIYEEVDAGGQSKETMQLTAAPTVAPGNYNVTVRASSGSFALSYTFVVQVVKYLVVANLGAFHPTNLTVPLGSTVFWINLSTDDTAQYDVIFHNMNLHSPVLNPTPAYDSWSYTFTSAGTYSYYSDYLPGNAMSGTVTVTG
jgi:plastocyanin